MGTSVGRAGERLPLVLTPLTHALAAHMDQCGYNPFLELTLASSKGLPSVLRHLARKWQTATPGNILMHPPCDCPIPLRGVSWGGPDCDARLTVRVDAHVDGALHVFASCWC
jgi:hypothetical protein